MVQVFFFGYVSGISSGKGDFRTERMVQFENEQEINCLKDHYSKYTSAPSVPWHV